MFPPPICTDDDGQQCAWDAPLTRLMLLLEIADEPDWLRDLAEVPADSSHPCDDRYGNRPEVPPNE